MRTIKELRTNVNGKLHVFCKDEAIAKRFLEDAEKEGFMFGMYKPTSRSVSDIYAIEDDHTLAHVGTYGRMAFQTGESVRIDYSKYIAGDLMYTI